MISPPKKKLKKTTMISLCMTALLVTFASANTGGGVDPIACKAIETKVKGMLSGLSDIDTAKADAATKAKIVAFCKTFSAASPAQLGTFAKCSESNKQLVHKAKKVCQARQKPGGEKNDKRPEKCENPIVVSTANCKKDYIGKIQGACGRQLVKACIKASKQDCGHQTSGVSAQACTAQSLGSALKQKPECLIPLRTACRSVTPVIPKECVSWFDGCNTCKVTDGKKSGCTRKYCSKKNTDIAKAFCKEFKDGNKCIKQRSTGKSECDKPKTVKSLTCETVTSNLDLSPEKMCVKALSLCEDNAEFVQNCETLRQKQASNKCKNLPSKDKKNKAICCVQGILEKSACGDYGSSDVLPSDCKRCVQDGKLKVSDKTCVRCRGKDNLRPEGVKDDKDQKTKPFDPARIKDTIKKVASGLNEDGKKCVKRVAQAASTLKTQIRRWRDDPSKDEESTDEVDLKSVADVQADIDEVADESEDVENEFADDDKGKEYRKKEENEQNFLKDKISDANKPKNCVTEFTALKKAYNEIVTGYAGLPDKLKKDGVQRVPLGFADTDIGNTDLKDSKSVCTFAKKLVGKLKKAEDNNKKRLNAARELICTKAGALLKSKVISNFFTCLRKSKKDADAGTNAKAKDDAQKDITTFDNNGYKRIERLLKLMGKKCLIKDTAKSKKARVVSLFRKTLKAKIKRKTGDAALSDDEKQKIADDIRAAVLKKYSQAKNIETTFPSSNRRQLRPRRALSGEIEVQTNFNLGTPGQVAGAVDLNSSLNGFNVVSQNSSLQPTSGAVENADSVTEINDNLPTGETSPQETPPQAPTAEEKADVSTGVKQVVFGAAAVICATALLV